MSNVTGTVVDGHAASGARRFVVEWRYAELLVVKSLLVRVVEVVECDRVDNLEHTEFLNFFVCVETERHASEAV